MTPHLSSRLVSRLVLFAAIFLQLRTPATAQSVATPQTTPTVAERLDRLAAEIERNRVDLHVPGAALWRVGPIPG